MHARGSIILYLTQEDVKEVLDMKTTIEVVEEAFKEMRLGQIEMPPRLYLHFEKYGGIQITMPAYLRVLDAAGVKVVTDHPKNPSQYGIPFVMATIILCEPKDGTHITMLRTGAAGACGAKYLSQDDSEKAAVIGLGAQGRSQLLGLLEVRAIKAVTVYDIIPQACKDFVKQMSNDTGVAIDVADSVGKAVEGADIVVTCTPSSQPFIFGNFIENGTHISAIGGDTRDKRELDTSALVNADARANSS